MRNGEQKWCEKYIKTIFQAVCILYQNFNLIIVELSSFWSTDNLTKHVYIFIVLCIFSLRFFNSWIRWEYRLATSSEAVELLLPPRKIFIGRRSTRQTWFSDLDHWTTWQESAWWWTFTVSNKIIRFNITLFTTLPCTATVLLYSVDKLARVIRPLTKAYPFLKNLWSACDSINSIRCSRLFASSVKKTNPTLNVIYLIGSLTIVYTV